ncbi:MAG: SpoIIE family protein phosphatase, partial [Sporomusaceae bacterium]|nr:SpoIIE family protein phosphatase [Sporomusaceae bacterium]
SFIKNAENIENLMQGLVDLNSALIVKTNQENDLFSNFFMAAQMGLLLVAVIAAGAVAFYIIKSISVPLKEAVTVLGKIAQGDFGARMHGDYKGDLAVIKNSVNDTGLKLSLYLEEKLAAERAAHQAEIAKTRLEADKEASLISINYAGKIQRNILPKDTVFQKIFRDYSVIWKPRDIVGGDFYWLKHYPEGAVLCVCDCTGHGTPGALLTMLLASTFGMMVARHNYQGTAQIIWELEQIFVSILNVETDGQKEMAKIQNGCDLAVLYIDDKSGNVKISAQNTHIFVCDGKKVTLLKGQNRNVGSGALKDISEIKEIIVPYNSENKFYIASDGLYEQPGGEKKRPFGYSAFKQLILENHQEPHSVISAKIWQAFENYRGDNPRVDDVQLITFTPR